MFLVTSNEVASLPGPRNAQSTLSRRLSAGDSKRPPAGESRHPPHHPCHPPSSFRSPTSSLVRKHVPDSDPGCALQSPSIPALRRRNVPNCRPMVDGGMRKCSAGACPPQGSGWGVAESVVPIRCTKPQLRLFIPWCAGASRHERLVRKYAPPETPGRPRHSGESRNPEGWGEGIVALGLVPSLGRTARSRKLHGPAYHHFHPLMRPSQSHGDSRAGGNPGEARTEQSGQLSKTSERDESEGARLRLLYLDGRGLR